MPSDQDPVIIVDSELIFALPYGIALRLHIDGEEDTYSILEIADPFIERTLLP